jgi:thioredoxin 1
MFVTEEEVELNDENHSIVVTCALMIALGANGASVKAAEPQINMQALAAKKMPVLLEFGRGWCIPCKYMKPILDDMSKAYAGQAIVTTVDMDANKDLVRQFRIRMMPTQVFLTPDGKEFLRNEGTLEREQIMKIFAQMGLPAPATQGPTRAAAPPQAPVRQ